VASLDYNVCSKTGLAQTWHDPIVNGINDLQKLSKTHCQVTLARVRSGILCAITTWLYILPKLIASYAPTTTFG
jgi:hypothetical protein